VTTDSGTSEDPSGLGKKLAVAGITLLFQALEDRDIDAPKPQVVSCGPHQTMLADLALQFGTEGREDASALAALNQAACSDATDLRRAAAILRSAGWDREDIAHFRANRLLLAAARDEPFEPLTGEEQEWFRQVQALRDARPDQGFVRLVLLQPALGLLEQEVLELCDRCEALALDGEQRERTIGDMIWKRASELVGTESSSPEPMVRTVIAWYVTRDHLRMISGLRDLNGEAK
jgi:hypothetical protein